jgi:hypothetical protein
MPSNHFRKLVDYQENTPTFSCSYVPTMLPSTNISLLSNVLTPLSVHPAKMPMKLYTTSFCHALPMNAIDMTSSTNSIENQDRFTPSSLTPKQSNYSSNKLPRQDDSKPPLETWKSLTTMFPWALAEMAQTKEPTVLDTGPAQQAIQLAPIKQNIVAEHDKDLTKKTPICKRTPHTFPPSLLHTQLSQLSFPHFIFLSIFPSSPQICANITTGCIC